MVEPQEGECVLCFVARAVRELGCDTTLRWTSRFREHRVPDAIALEQRMTTAGGSCDCGIFRTGYQLAREHLERDIDTDVLSAPAVPPTCSGVRRTSARPCRNWERTSRRTRVVGPEEG